VIARRALGLSARRLTPLVALVAAGGCFATRSDVKLVQTDIASLRAEVIKHEDDARAGLAAANKLLQAATDSLTKVSARTVSIQGDVRGETRTIKEQLLQIQQLLGQSQATIARMRAELAERGSVPPVLSGPVTTMPTQNPPAPLVPPAGKSGTNATSPTNTGAATDAMMSPRGPGPAELFQNGRDQQTRGSSGTARMLFQELLTNYPTSDEAPDAQFWIAESFANEKNPAAADAAYAAVVTKYPEAPKAPTALYKRAVLYAKQGNNAKARELFEQVVSRYPKSDEAVFATDQLKTLR